MISFWYKICTLKCEVMGRQKILQGLYGINSVTVATPGNGSKLLFEIKSLAFGPATAKNIGPF